MIDLIDTNNWYRRRIEEDTTGRAPRNTANWVNSRQDPDPIIFVFDGANGNARRREIFPDYKGKRPPASDGIHEAIRFLRKEILPLTKASILRVPGWEADDVLATMAIVGVRMGKKVTIHSNDFDLKQLEQATNGQVTVQAKDKEGVTPDRIRLFKTWVGDPSDNIPGVRLFGKQAWDAADKDALQALTNAIVLGEPYDLEPFGFKPSVKRWLEENPATLKAMWDITGLMLVPDDELLPQLKQGKPDLVAQHELFARFMQ